MVKIERGALIDDVADRTGLDADTLEDLADDDLRELHRAAVESDDGDPDTADVESTDDDGEVTGAASASSRSSGLLASETVEAVVEGSVDGDAFDDDTLRASVEEHYGHNDAGDYTTGVEGGTDASMNPQQALLAAQSGGGIGGTDADDSSADPSDYSAGTEGDA